MIKLKKFFKHSKKVKFDESKNETHEIDYEYDRTREKISMKPKTEFIKAIIEINEIKQIMPCHKDSIKNVHFKELSLNSYIKYYDDIDDELKRVLITT